MNLTKQFYKDFPTDSFEEEARYFCYEIARELIAKSKIDTPQSWYTNEKTVKGILLLLFCWNFAARITKGLTHKATKELLIRQKQNLIDLEGFCILDNWERQDKKIKIIYKDFKKIFGQTGASKALSLLNPELFVMWDTEIRYFLSNRKADRELRIEGIGNGETGESYIIFLRGIKKIVNKLGLYIKTTHRIIDES